MLKIKKYNNRKLYILGQGYITLSQLLNKVKEGKQVQITDEVTKEDITSQVLITALIGSCNNSNAIHNFIRNNVIL